MNSFNVQSSNRSDKSNKKRVELHLHTKMSPMDALISPKEAIKAAKEWGHSAIAITDHGGVQAFPEFMRVSQKYGVKAIYGMEINIKEDFESDFEGYHLTILVKNQKGLKNLYRIVSDSHLNHLNRNRPIYLKKELEKYREGLLFGSACGKSELFFELMANTTDEILEKIVRNYDYLEIQPICCNRHFVEMGLLDSDEDIIKINRRIIALGERYNKLVVATGNAHFLEPEDEICRKILLGGKYAEDDMDRGFYLRTTDEMLEEFSYLGEEKAYEVVVENTNKINELIETVLPIPDRSFELHLEGSEDELKNICEARFNELFGEVSSSAEKERLNNELNVILKNGYATLYMIAKRMVDKSRELGYRVCPRGCVGSSLVAYLLGITDIDPLKYNIPYETLLGFYGDKVPDIDLNFSPDVAEIIREHVIKMFGEDKVFVAGTIGTVSEKTAYGFAKKYFNDHNILVSEDEITKLAAKCVGTKRITGQHPGGIMIIPQGFDVHDFTPLQHPADDPTSKVISTHFGFADLYYTVLKIDLLQYDVPTRYKLLEDLTGVKVEQVPLNDEKVLELFKQGETCGLPEFGTQFVKGILNVTRPQNFEELIKISGLVHGTNTWNENAQELIQNGECTLSDVIACREDIMLYLMKHGVDRKTSFIIMESVRKGKGLTEEHEKAMKAVDIPNWYIESCKKIKYLFPKAHAVAYVMSAVRLAWYKLYYPIEFYSSALTVNSFGLEESMIANGKLGVEKIIREIEAKGTSATPREQGSLSALYLVKESMSREIEYLRVNFNKSDAESFLIENGAIRMPITSVCGIALHTAQNIIKAREEHEFESIADLQQRANISNEHIEMLRKTGILYEPYE